MEEELDDGRGRQGRIGTRSLNDFYGPFARQLARRRRDATSEKVRGQGPRSPTCPCDKCGAMMVYKMGRFGRFLACPNFPECRNTMPIVRTIDAHCPKCGGAILVRNTKRGRVFYGCEHYPECDFVSWDMPVREKCPVCGSMMVLKRGRKGAMAHVCTNETCRHRVELAAPESEDSAE